MVKEKIKETELTDIKVDESKNQKVSQELSREEIIESIIAERKEALEELSSDIDKAEKDLSTTIQEIIKNWVEDALPKEGHDIANVSSLSAPKITKSELHKLGQTEKTETTAEETNVDVRTKAIQSSLKEVGSHLKSIYDFMPKDAKNIGAKRMKNTLVSPERFRLFSTIESKAKNIEALIQKIKVDGRLADKDRLALYKSLTLSIHNIEASFFKQVMEDIDDNIEQLKISNEDAKDYLMEELQFLKRLETLWTALFSRDDKSEKNSLHVKAKVAEKLFDEVLKSILANNPTLYKDIKEIQNHGAEESTFSFHYASFSSNNKPSKALANRVYSFAKKEGYLKSSKKEREALELVLHPNHVKNIRADLGEDYVIYMYSGSCFSRIKNFTKFSKSLFSATLNTLIHSAMSVSPTIFIHLKGKNFLRNKYVRLYVFATSSLLSCYIANSAFRSALYVNVEDKAISTSPNVTLDTSLQKILGAFSTEMSKIIVNAVSANLNNSKIIFQTIYSRGMGSPTFANPNEVDCKSNFYKRYGVTTKAKNCVSKLDKILHGKGKARTDVLVSDEQDKDNKLVIGAEL